MAICDGGGVEGRKHENVAEKQQWRYVMVAGMKGRSHTCKRVRKTTMAICDGGGVEGRIQENVAKKQGRYVMVAGLKVAYRRK
ncbi:hypothetical protein DPMN_161440 [Dreissena polymorpha]|uniref:Uncharacterized protein n=1 Tax=Dreissena polymorpha TaxID=45954 RepID=A0A9D4ISP5_DREPO|nr:hypothetical protein DPMN_161440 [Dreissena polymorpha]